MFDTLGMMDNGDRGFRLLSSSSTSFTRTNRSRGGDAFPVVLERSSLAGQLVPWMALGFSMGIAYFGVETLAALFYSDNLAGNHKKERRRNPVQSQITDQLQQLREAFSNSDAKVWFLQWWTLPSLRHDIFWGVFISALPIPDDSEGEASANRNPARVLGPNNRVPDEKENNDVFLTLPPQLQPRLPPKASGSTPKKERYLEMLLHNVSHTDLVLGFDTLNSDGKLNNTDTDLKSMCLCRPRFSAFDLYCRKLLQALEQPDNEEAEIILVPQYQRSQSDPRYTIQPSDRPHISTGFCWKSCNDQTQNNPRVILLTQALADLRVRGKDMAKVDRFVDPNLSSSLSPPPSPRMHQDMDENQSNAPSVSTWDVVSIGQEAATTSTEGLPLSKEDILVELKAIFFPLLATLLPRWHEQISQKYSKWSRENVQKVLVLVTGVGTPRNWTHSITGNSTQALADLMELYLAKVYPDITVVKIHSDTNIFRYDDNILFVQQELLPVVNGYRDAHATQAPYPHEISAQSKSNNSRQYPVMTSDAGFEQQLQPQAQEAQNAFDVDWKRSFAVTLSFADGSPARTHAIQTALRIFRPTYFHIWQLKTFWHERKIVDDDVEIHSFEEMETSPALESNLLRGELAQVVQEMKSFQQEMKEIMLKKDSNDIDSFWLRKTHKPVLAVLLVQSEGQPPALYRGTNMEVSMPTGSLCAERNVIGTALASNPKLKRQDLKCIAVLAVPPPATEGSKLRSASLGSASDSLKKSRHNSFEEAAVSAMNARQMRRQSFDEKEEDDWMLSGSGNEDGNFASERMEVDEAHTATQDEDQAQSHEAPLRQISLFSSSSSNSLVDMIKKNTDGSKSPHVSSRNKKSLAGASSPATIVQEKRTIIVRSNNHDIDLNPLRPCGACHEWLKKIAECNPYFQIMTFTDADCNGVYVIPCQE